MNLKASVDRNCGLMVCDPHHLPCSFIGWTGRLQSLNQFAKIDLRNFESGKVGASRNADDQAVVTSRPFIVRLEEFTNLYTRDPHYRILVGVEVLPIEH